MIVFVVTVFVGALLIFQIQPILGRYILPWFGGGPGVWTTCLLFFQAALLGGYVYAHLLVTRVKPRAQGLVHMTLLAVSLLALPISPNEAAWKAAIEGDPTWTILALLTVSAGLPYLALSATAPLAQRWFHRLYPERSAYRLYAVSNGGSLLALISYPIVVEPSLRVESQTAVWSWGYAVFAGICGLAALRASRAPEVAAPAPQETAAGNGGRRRKWLLLSAVGSALLVATTNQMSQEVAVIPFLWVLPLVFYLLSFILCFESDRWYDRRLFSFLLALAAPSAAVAMAAGGLLPLEAQIGIYSGALFIGCMVCHGELARARPPAVEATSFYLYVAAGGALGGVFVAVAAARLFRDYWEYPLALAACCAILLSAWWKSGWRPNPQRPQTLLAPPPALAVALLALGYGSAAMGPPGAQQTVRGFYGVLRLIQGEDGAGKYLALTHGRTEHGTEYLEGKSAGLPTTYFGPGTGAALAIERHPKRLAGAPLRIAVIGLGAGTLAAYGRPGDLIVFYEINAQVARIANRDFSYLSRSEADTAVVLGDARIRLEAEIESGDRPYYDVLLIDAFSSGAIPIHLLTAEAAEVYARRITEDGVLAFHITNRFVDLSPVINGLANHLGMQRLRVTTRGDDAGANTASWMILTRDSRFLEDAAGRQAADPDLTSDTLDWSDAYSGLWQALR